MMKKFSLILIISFLTIYITGCGSDGEYRLLKERMDNMEKQLSSISEILENIQETENYPSKSEATEQSTQEPKSPTEITEGQSAEENSVDFVIKDYFCSKAFQAYYEGGNLVQGLTNIMPYDGSPLQVKVALGEDNQVLYADTGRYTLFQLFRKYQEHDNGSTGIYITSVFSLDLCDTEAENHYLLPSVWSISINNDMSNHFQSYLDAISDLIEPKRVLASSLNYKEEYADCVPALRVDSSDGKEIHVSFVYLRFHFDEYKKIQTADGVIYEDAAGNRHESIINIPHTIEEFPTGDTEVWGTEVVLE